MFIIYLFTKASWPGVGQLPDYSKITFPDTVGVALADLVPEVRTCPCTECVYTVKEHFILHPANNIF